LSLFDRVVVRSSCSCLSFVLVFIACLTAARAVQAKPLRLSWEAPPECPIADKVLEQATKDIARDAPLLIDARAVVENGGANWVVRLHTMRAGIAGERVIEASSCTGAADATAVVLSLALLSSARAAASVEEASPLDTTPQQTRERASTPTIITSKRDTDFALTKAHNDDRERTRTVSIGAAALGDAGSLPSVAPGGRRYGPSSARSRCHAST
jgi:hypothetical protein